MPNFGLGRRAVDRANERDPINWRRGLFRVWVLLSSAWLMAWGIYLTIEQLRGALVADAAAIATMLLGPPMALLVFGIAAGWAMRGFLAGGDAPEDRR